MFGVQKAILRTCYNTATFGDVSLWRAQAKLNLRCKRRGSGAHVERNLWGTVYKCPPPLRPTSKMSRESSKDSESLLVPHSPDDNMPSIGKSRRTLPTLGIVASLILAALSFFAGAASPLFKVSCHLRVSDGIPRWLKSKKLIHD